MPTPRITFFPLGNADTSRLDLRDGRKMLVDYADMRNGDDRADKRIELPAALRQDLRASSRDYYDIVCFTHLDDDHVHGSSEFFEFDHAAKYQGGGRIKIKELWVPDPRPVLRTPIADWTIFYDEGLLGDIRVARKRALPAETGGALVGIVDVNRKVILVVDALSPPADSIESHAEFVRGIDGLTDHLQEVCALTRDQVRYVGEWHTHPSCHRATPSSTDLAQLEFLRAQLGREGIPPVMIIMGEQEEAVVSAFRPDQSKNPEA